MRLVAAVIAAAALFAPAPVSAQVIDLSTIKCKAFFESPQETVSLLLMWLDGYYANQNDAAIVNFDRMKERAAKLGEYCAKNPDNGLITAAEEIMG